MGNCAGSTSRRSGYPGRGRAGRARELIGKNEACTTTMVSNNWHVHDGGRP